MSENTKNPDDPFDEETTSIQIPSRMVEAHRQFVAAAKEARAAGPDEEEKALARHLFATTYHA